MILYILRRILYAIPIAFGVSVVCFALVYIAPGDPLQTVMPPDATAETIAGLPEIVELNIGYYMIGEALFVGLAETVRAMRAAMDRGRKSLVGKNQAAQNLAGKA